MSFYKTIPLIGCLLFIQACGFQPLYGVSSSTAMSEFDHIKVESIPDRVGQLLHNRLLTALNPKGRPKNPLYVLTVKVHESSTSLAVRKSAFATRANLNVKAGFGLTTIKTGESLYSGASVITVSYNILDSEFATLAAEKDARSRAVREVSHGIRNQLGVYFSRAQAGGS